MLCWFLYLEYFQRMTQKIYSPSENLDRLSNLNMYFLACVYTFDWYIFQLIMCLNIYFTWYRHFNGTARYTLIVPVSSAVLFKNPDLSLNELQSVMLSFGLFLFFLFFFFFFFKLFNLVKSTNFYKFCIIHSRLINLFALQKHHLAQ